MSLRKIAVINTIPRLSEILEETERKKHKRYNCRIIGCFYITDNGFKRLKRHYKIYHEFNGKYDLSINAINTSIWHINRKKGLYSTPNSLSTLPLCCLSPRGEDRISTPK